MKDEGFISNLRLKKRSLSITKKLEGSHFIEDTPREQKRSGSVIKNVGENQISYNNVKPRWKAELLQKNSMQVKSCS